MLNSATPRRLLCCWPLCLFQQLKMLSRIPPRKRANEFSERSAFDTQSGFEKNFQSNVHESFRLWLVQVKNIPKRRWLKSSDGFRFIQRFDPTWQITVGQPYCWVDISDLNSAFFVDCCLLEGHFIYLRVHRKIIMCQEMSNITLKNWWIIISFW